MDRPRATSAMSLVALGLAALVASACSTSSVKPPPYGDCKEAAGCDVLEDPPSVNPSIDAGRGDAARTDSGTITDSGAAPADTGAPADADTTG